MEIDIKDILKKHPPVLAREADGGYSAEIPTPLADFRIATLIRKRRK